MKVLFVASDNNRSSGAFLSMTVLNRCLREQFDVETMVILPREGNGTTLLEENQIPHCLVPSYDWVIQKGIKKTPLFYLKSFLKRLKNKQAAKKIAKIAAEGNYDLIHINTLYSYVGAHAAKMAGIPYIWHMREMIEAGQNRVFQNAHESYALIGRSACIMAISTSVFNYYCNNISCRNMRVVYNGIDSERFFKPNKQIFCGKKPIIMFVGGFNKNKGAFVLCDALKRVVADPNCDIEIWFVGEPTDRFKEYVSNNELTPYVTFWGYQKNVEEFYEKADITITGGKMEAFGRTTAEAMLCGDLVIATDTAGSKELVFNNETGLSYPFGNAKQLAKKIRYALMHQEEMRCIAKAGQNFILQNMTATLNAERVYSQYQRVLYKWNQS